MTGRPVTPWPRYDVERSSVRVVLLDDADRLLLFDTVDPTMPELGRWWETPGGGAEPGEDVLATARREVEEETGFALDAADVGAPTWTRHVTYVRRHVRVWQHEHVVTARVRLSSPVPAPEGRTPEELLAYVGHRWFEPAEVESAAAAGERFFPASLPVLLRRFLAGDVLDEPFELWC